MTPLKFASMAIQDKLYETNCIVSDDEAEAATRAALLALAEADLGAFDRAVTGPSAMRTDASDRAGIFRVLLRSIANEGKTDV